MRKSLSGLEAFFFSHSASIQWMVVGGMFGCSALSSGVTLGQTFLEKLETAVRQQLGEAQSAQNPAGSVSQSGAAEELPAPSANRSPNVKGEARNFVPSPVQSVLEDPVGAKAPAPGAVAPLVLEGGEAGSIPADRRIYLGLEAEELTGGGIGVRVTNITKDSPAWKAGFKVGDRIMGINGFAIANLEDMVKQLGKTSPGETVRFLVSRTERNLELVAVLMEAGLAERIAGSSIRVGDLSAGDVDGPAWIGVMVNDLTPAFRNQFGLNVFRGAAVTSVSPNSPAFAIGMMAGDAIVSIGGVAIETSGDLMKWMLTARPGQEVDITYQRGSSARNSRLTLQVNPENRPAYRANRSVVPIQPNLDINVLPSNSVVPPVPNNPTADGTSVVEVAELQREIATLKSELQRANQRLETTQNRLKQILEGLGNN